MSGGGAFVGYIYGDSTRKLLWDASVTLDFYNPMVQESLEGLGQIIGGDPVAFLITCKSEL